MVQNLLLQGKRILVTGASSGIGRATAVCCAEMGADVVLTGRDLPRLEETLSKIAYGKHSVIVQDLSETEHIEKMFERVVADGNRLDGMVHCAGIPCVMPVKALTRQRLEQVMNVNLYSYVELCRQFSKKKYSNDGASIVGMSALIASHPRAYELAYIASKAAVEAATKVMALEFGKRNIRVNCVSPGFVKTEILNQVQVDDNTQMVLNKQAERAIKGWLKPEDVAKVCMFLLSDLSSSVTGKIVDSDGGYF